MILSLDPREAGLEPSERFPHTYGAVMETGYAEGSSTLVSLSDGTTSLYLSSGGGFIGGGAHELVATASLAFIDAVESSLGDFAVAPDDAVPSAGHVSLLALTFGGARRVLAAEADLGSGRHPASPIFYAAHDVITQFRLLQEGEPG